jgi:hypothetical protein
VEFLPGDSGRLPSCLERIIPCSRDGVVGRHPLIKLGQPAHFAHEGEQQ